MAILIVGEMEQIRVSQGGEGRRRKEGFGHVKFKMSV